jgi:hypothetical protein
MIVSRRRFPLRVNSRLSATPPRSSASGGEADMDYDRLQSPSQVVLPQKFSNLLVGLNVPWPEKFSNFPEPPMIFQVPSMNVLCHER